MTLMHPFVWLPFRGPLRSFPKPRAFLTYRTSKQSAPTVSLCQIQPSDESRPRSFPMFSTVSRTGSPVEIVCIWVCVKKGIPLLRHSGRPKGNQPPEKKRGLMLRDTQIHPRFWVQEVDARGFRNKKPSWIHGCCWETYFTFLILLWFSG